MPPARPPLCPTWTTLTVGGRVVVLDARDAAELAGRDLVLLRERPHLRYLDAGRWRLVALARLLARAPSGLVA
jgi:hypothetical protein